MKTLEQIQYEVGSKMTPEQKRRFKIVYLMRLGAFVGDLFDTASECERLESIGHMVLVISQYCCVEGITIPYGSHCPPKEEMDLSLDFAGGSAVWVGHLMQTQVHAVEDGVPDPSAYQKQVACCIAHLLQYLDRLCRDICQHDNLLIVTNNAYQQWVEEHETAKSASVN